MKNPLSHCQLGYRPDSPKSITLVPTAEATGWPDRIPFYLRRLLQPLARHSPVPAVWQGGLFRWPFHISSGHLQPDPSRVLWQGHLQRLESRWGTFWQGDFSAFREEGNFQIETDYGCTFPLQIRRDLCDRLQYGYLHYLQCQRSGQEIPGIRPAEHLDDGILDRDGTPITAAGGWYDAGDLRKWLFLTLPNLAALASIAERGVPGLRRQAVDEIAWGNRFFHSMIARDGQVWEDLAGGTLKPGLNYRDHWWYENHPGCNCNASDCRYTDNIPGSGDERLIRTTWNPAVQYLFVRTQCQVAPHFSRQEFRKCVGLAERAWTYGQSHPHDDRTLFLAEEFWAALELWRVQSSLVTADTIRRLWQRLRDRQDLGAEGLSGYFLEKDARDGFRSIALSCEPALATLRLCELLPEGLEQETEEARASVTRYIDHYLLRDAASNPFSLTPYGVYIAPPWPEHQTFREAGRGRGVRTFIHPFSPQQIVHGTGGVTMHQALLLAKAGRLLERSDWCMAAEKLVHWTLGHNPESLCLHTGVGYRHPTPFSSYITQVPNAVCVGHIGWPDDRPYLETSELIEWSTQEIWDIPHAYLAEAVLQLA